MNTTARKPSDKTAAERLGELILCSPHVFGYEDTMWTFELLQHQLQQEELSLSQTAIQKLLRERGFHVTKRQRKPRRTVRISRFAKLVAALQAYRSDFRWIFRGQPDVEWGLVPKAGRSPFSRHDDLQFLEQWKRQAVALLSPRPESEWDWAAVAQHHGLATRLLDWTYKPLVAAYFAVSSPADAEKDAVVYAYCSNRVLEPDKDSIRSFTGVARLRPSAFASRITAQGGLFTVHNPPYFDLKNNVVAGEALDVLVIAGEYKRELLWELDQCGVNHFTVFPDADGLSRWLNWNWADWTPPQSQSRHKPDEPAGT